MENPGIRNIIPSFGPGSEHENPLLLSAKHYEVKSQALLDFSFGNTPDSRDGEFSQQENMMKQTGEGEPATDPLSILSRGCRKRSRKMRSPRTSITFGEIIPPDRQNPPTILNIPEFSHQPHRRPSAEIIATFIKARFPPDLSNIDIDIFQRGLNLSPVKQQETPPALTNENEEKMERCKYRGCKNTTLQSSLYCASHAGSRKCQHEGCTKCAQGGTKFCISHGGGRRCTFPGCTKGARDKFFCAAHGGGKRCEVEGCTKSAVGSSKFCTNHGGGKRCREPGCQKSAQSSTPYCVRHGGGRKCCVPGCSKLARGKNNSCSAHMIEESLEIPLMKYQLGSICSSTPAVPFLISHSDEIKIDSNPLDIVPTSECHELIDLMTSTQLTLK